MKEIFNDSDLTIVTVLPEAKTVDEKVENARILQAQQMLKERNFIGAYNHVSEYPTTNIPVERIRFLALFGVSDEKELSVSATSVHEDERYKNIVANGSPDMIRVYKKLREMTELNRLEYEEIIECNKLFEVNLLDDAELYAKQMTEKHPDNCLSWARYAEAKFRKLGNFSVSKLSSEEIDELLSLGVKMEECSNYAYFGVREGWYIYFSYGKATAKKDGHNDDYVQKVTNRISGVRSYRDLIKKEKEERRQAQIKEQERKETEQKEKKRNTIYSVIGVAIAFAFMIITSILFQSCM